MALSGLELVDLARIELATSSLRTMRSPMLSYRPTRLFHFSSASRTSQNAARIPPIAKTALDGAPDVTMRCDGHPCRHAAGTRI